MGRPLKEIDGDEVFKLAKLGCTQEEIGEFFGCARSVISQRFRQEFDLGSAASKTSIRRWQMKRAHAGSDSMLIHLGKNMLGQTEKVDVNALGGLRISVVYEDDNTQVDPPPPRPAEGDEGGESV